MLFRSDLWLYPHLVSGGGSPARLDTSDMSFFASEELKLSIEQVVRCEDAERALQASASADSESSDVIYAATLGDLLCCKTRCFGHAVHAVET